MTTPWYDDPIIIAERIEQGLAALQELAGERHRAGYDRRERLSEWCILGRFNLDSCGNFGLITEGAPADTSHLGQIPVVIPSADVFKYTELCTVGFGNYLPPAGGSCDLCCRTWTMADLGRVTNAHINGYGEPPVWRHKGCQNLARIEVARVELQDIARRSCISTSTYLIPNEYSRHDEAEPWMMLVTSRGRIKVGWRRRVISIDWTHSTLTAPPFLFADERVTQSGTGIHAYGADKAVEYLRRLWKANGCVLAVQEAA